MPGFTLGAADFGVISSARAPRTVQRGADSFFDTVGTGDQVASESLDERPAGVRGPIFDRPGPVLDFIREHRGWQHPVGSGRAFAKRHSGDATRSAESTAAT